jgi:hypothetical protein
MEHNAKTDALMYGTLAGGKAAAEPPADPLALLKSKVEQLKAEIRSLKGEEERQKSFIFPTVSVQYLKDRIAIDEAKLKAEEEEIAKAEKAEEAKKTQAVAEAKRGEETQENEEDEKEGHETGTKEGKSSHLRHAPTNSDDDDRLQTMRTNQIALAEKMVKKESKQKEEREKVGIFHSETTGESEDQTRMNWRTDIACQCALVLLVVLAWVCKVFRRKVENVDPQPLLSSRPLLVTTTLRRSWSLPLCEACCVILVP